MPVIQAPDLSDFLPERYDSSLKGRSIADIHAQLGKIIEAGHGDKRLYIELDYKSGLLMGQPVSEVLEIVAEYGSRNFSKTEEVFTLRPTLSLVHVARDDLVPIIKKDFENP